VKSDAMSHEWVEIHLRLTANSSIATSPFNSGWLLPRKRRRKARQPIHHPSALWVCASPPPPLVAPSSSAGVVDLFAAFFPRLLEPRLGFHNAIGQVWLDPRRTFVIIA
jgi:hypothetical protein